MIPRITLSAVASEDGDLIVNAGARIGTTLREKYRIDGVLGVGGMGVVYLATHRNGKRFAIKLLHPEFSSRRDLRTRFLREGYVANAVGHPGVVSVLDDDVAEDGSAFLVMELLDGNTVDALGARPGSRMAVHEALGIAYQMLDVLEAAHAKSIIHRDIKPANVFVLRDGQVKVLDFGLARLKDATASLDTTRTGEQMGTPAFMAPEQARGDVKAIDRRTDIWAVGATLFTAISGHLVYEGANARQLMVRAATSPPRSLSSLFPKVPRAVTEVVDKALAFEMDARWDSARAMRDAVKAAHEALYGKLARENLQLLFNGDHVAEAYGPTEPSPGFNSLPRLRDSTVISATGDRKQVDSATLVRNDPQSVDGNPPSTTRWRRYVTAAALVFVGSVSFLYHRRELPAVTTASNTPIEPRHPAPDSPPENQPAPVPRPAASLGVEPALVSTQPPNQRPSRSTQRQPTRRIPPASAVVPALASAAIPSEAASSVQSREAVTANASAPPQSAKPHRRIDDVVDHQ